MRLPGNRGLTLLEIMIGLTITAIIASVVYGSLRTAGSSLQTLSVRNQLYRSAHALLEEMGRELACAYLSRNQPPSNGRARTHFWVEDREVYDMPQDRLSFTTYGHAFSIAGTGESDQSEICYEARYSEKRQELILLKREDVTIDDVSCRDEPLEDWEERYEEPPTPVAAGIHPEKGTGYRLVGFQLECFANLADEEAAVEWDSEKNRSLPSRMVVTITYQDGAENLYPFSKEVIFRLKDSSLIQQGGGPPAGGAGTAGGPGTGGMIPRELDSLLGEGGREIPGIQ